jgi:hypothetical protein
MKVKGDKVNNAMVGIAYRGYKKLSEDRIERGERNSASVRKNEVWQDKQESIAFNPGSQWTEVKKEFTVKFEDKNLLDLTLVPAWTLSMVFTLTPGAGTLYIDDVKISEK